MDWKKIAPWNWFRKEQERDVRVTRPTVARDPLTALHQEMDRGVAKREPAAKRGRTIEIGAG